MNNKIELADKVAKCTTKRDMMMALGTGQDKSDPIAAAGINKIDGMRDARDRDKKK